MIMIEHESQSDYFSPTEKRKNETENQTATSDDNPRKIVSLRSPCRDCQSYANHENKRRNDVEWKL